jgi:dihydrofolate reductase
MREIKVNMFVTLDGVMQAPGGPGEDDEGGFKHGGWQGAFGDEVTGEAIGRLMDAPFDLLLGRKTYDIFNGYWPHQSDPIAEKFAQAHKYVASRKLDKAEWQPSTVIKDVPGELAKLKAADGPELQTWGSADLIQTLLKHGLVDEFRLLIYPLVLGSGKKLFAEGTMPVSMKVVDSLVSPKGVVIVKYRPAGEVVYMTVGEEEPAKA